jgi:hypothetical protein
MGSEHKVLGIKYRHQSHDDQFQSPKYRADYNASLNRVFGEGRKAKSTLHAFAAWNCSQPLVDCLQAKYRAKLLLCGYFTL